MDHDYDEIAGELDSIFNPEPDEDGHHREWPQQRLKDYHGLDFTYLEDWLWEGATSHPNTRLWPEKEPGGDELTRSMDVGRRLFYSALRVFGDSILTYATSSHRRSPHERSNPSELRYYPPVILTFWSGFEAFIRHSSELMIHTSKDLPVAVADYLRDEVTVVGRKGTVEKETKYRPALDRYATLLQYGMNYKIDRGNKYWQALVGARELRDYYTHRRPMNSPKRFLLMTCSPSWRPSCSASSGHPPPLDAHSSSVSSISTGFGTSFANSLAKFFPRGISSSRSSMTGISTDGDMGSTARSPTLTT